MTSELATPPALQATRPARSTAKVAVLVVVEGTNDIEFLRRISAILHRDRSEVPDLSQMEQDGRLLFLPAGGSDHRLWRSRLAPLHIPEFHLLDRDVPPLTKEREAAVDAINSRRGCVAAMTGKRSVENYIHPQAIFKARGVQLNYGDQDDVAEMVAQCCYALCGGSRPWREIHSRKRRRMKNQAKGWLNSEAVSRMTPKLLDEHDPQGEVRSWLEAIGWLASSAA